MYEDCIGPSAYWKAQGTPVRVWGMLVGGVLFITILAEKVRMNGEVYAVIIQQHFAEWMRLGLGTKAARLGGFLVQDHEKCLWKDAPRRAMKDAAIELLENFPKCSQDLSPIEIAWRELRARLDVTVKTHKSPETPNPGPHARARPLHSRQP